MNAAHCSALDVVYHVNTIRNLLFTITLIFDTDKRKYICRRAVLQQCIRDDFQNNPKDKLAQLWRAQGVRPGRLLNTIAAVVNGLNNQPGPATDERKVKEAARLAEIKNEALSLLSDLIDPGPM